MLNYTVITIISYCLINILHITNAQIDNSLLARNIKTRCSEWSLKHPHVSGLNCDKIWTDFKNIIGGSEIKKHCPTPPSIYDEFIKNLFSFEKTEDNLYFHSQVMQLVRGACKVSGLCKTLEVILPGYLMDNLDWCNKSQTAGIQYTTKCGCDYKSEMVFAYWKSASVKFAARAQGSVNVLLNGSVATPFNPNKTFGLLELPNVDPSKVKKVTVKLVHDLDNAIYDRDCESKTISSLKEIVTQKKIEFECQNNPPKFRHYQCMFAPGNKKCRLPNSSRTVRITGALICEECEKYKLFLQNSQKKDRNKQKFVKT